MGYTHYFGPKAGTKQAAAVLERKYKLAIKRCQQIAVAYKAQHGGLAGYTAHTKPGMYGGLNINGSGDAGHETFLMREHFSENANDFCKTARKPYDTVVTACLIVLAHYLGDAFEVSSDGDSRYWQDGLMLARQVTKLKGLSVPDGIEYRRPVLRLA